MADGADAARTHLPHHTVPKDPVPSSSESGRRSSLASEPRHVHASHAVVKLHSSP
jgi:hypothetical protein